MQPPAEAEAIGRAAQLLLYWRERDLPALCGVLARVTDVNEAKDIIVAMCMLAAIDPAGLTEITVQAATFPV